MIAVEVATVSSTAPFTSHATGSIGQEIHDADGKTIAWTTDGWLAQVICMLLNENEHLLKPKESNNVRQNRFAIDDVRADYGHADGRAGQMAFTA